MIVLLGCNFTSTDGLRSVLLCSNCDGWLSPTFWTEVHQWFTLLQVIILNATFVVWGCKTFHSLDGRWNLHVTLDVITKPIQGMNVTAVTANCQHLHPTKLPLFPWSLCVTRSFSKHSRVAQPHTHARALILVRDLQDSRLKLSDSQFEYKRYR